MRSCVRSIHPSCAPDRLLAIRDMDEVSARCNRFGKSHATMPNPASASRPAKSQISCSMNWRRCVGRSLGGDIAGMLAKALDAILDADQRLETRLDRIRGNILQDIGRDGITQTVEIVDELAAAL